MGFFDSIIKYFSDNMGSGRAAADVRLREAEMSLERGQFDEVLRILEEISYLEDGYDQRVRAARSAVNEAWGVELTKQGAYGSALSHFRQARSLPDLYPLAALCHHIAAMQKSGPDCVPYMFRLLEKEAEAEAVFRREKWALDEVVCHLATLLKGSAANTDDALKVIGRAVSIHRRKGYNYVKSSNWKQALTNFAAANRLAPDDIDTLEALARCQYLLKSSGCLSTLEELEKKVTDPLPYKLKRARAALGLGKQREALKTTGEMLSIVPDHFDAAKLHLKLLLKGWHYQAACEFLTTTSVLKQLPEYEKLIIGIALVANQPFDTSLISLLPDDELSYYIAGLHHLENGDYQQALLFLEKIRKWPHLIRYYQGYVYTELGELDKAADCLNSLTMGTSLESSCVVALQAYISRLWQNPCKVVDFLERIPGKHRGLLGVTENLVTAKQVLLQEDLVKQDYTTALCRYQELTKAGVALPRWLETILLFHSVLQNGIKADGGGAKDWRYILTRLKQDLPEDGVVCYLQLLYAENQDLHGRLSGLADLKDHPVVGGLAQRATVQLLWENGQIDEAIEVCREMGNSAPKIVGPANLAMLYLAGGDFSRTATLLTDYLPRHQDSAGEGELQNLALLLSNLISASESFDSPKVAFGDVPSVARLVSGDFVDNQAFLGILHQHVPECILAELFGQWLTGPDKSQFHPELLATIANWLGGRFLSGELDDLTAPAQKAIITQIAAYTTNDIIKVHLSLELAKDAYGRGAYRFAEALLRMLESQGEDSALVSHGLALVYEAQEQWSDAYRAWNEMIKDYEANQADLEILKIAHRRAAAIATRAELPQEVARHHRAVWQYDPTDDQMLESYIWALLGADQVKEAKEVLESRSRKGELSIELSLAKVSVLVASGDLVRAFCLAGDLGVAYPNHLSVQEELHQLWAFLYNSCLDSVQKVEEIRKDIDEKIGGVAPEDVNHAAARGIFLDLKEYFQKPYEILKEILSKLDFLVERGAMPRHEQLLQIMEACMYKVNLDLYFHSIGLYLNYRSDFDQLAFKLAGSLELVDSRDIRRIIDGTRTELGKLVEELESIWPEIRLEGDHEGEENHRQVVTEVRQLIASLRVRFYCVIHDQLVDMYDQTLDELIALMKQLETATYQEIGVWGIRNSLVAVRNRFVVLGDRLSKAAKELDISGHDELLSIHMELANLIQHQVDAVDKVLRIIQ